MAAAAAMASRKAVMICATWQHVGKTSVSMALVDAVGKALAANGGGEGGRTPRVGYMKPVGQKWVSAVNSRDPTGPVLRVDKDVALAREHFNMQMDYLDMSPIIIERGSTRDFLDGKRTEWEDPVITNRLRTAFAKNCAETDFLVVEGTGHCGVGSILGWNNARVAKALGIDVVLVANGGLGSTFDQLNLNRMACLVEGVDLAGVIVNKVRIGEEEKTRTYLEKAMNKFKWNAPLLGCVPYGDNLDQPSAMDLETLFETKLIGGFQHRLRRFDRYELVTTSLRRFMEKLAKEGDDILNTCFVTHASRNDIILGLLSHVSRLDSGLSGGKRFEGGLILTGSPPFNQPADFCSDYIHHANIPILNVPQSTSNTMDAIKSYTPKLSAADDVRTTRVIEQYSPHIDVARMLGLPATDARSPLLTVEG